MRKLLSPFGLAATILFSAPALAQEAPLTPKPDKWRPVVYRDLQIPGPLDAPFTGIWADMIDRNNRRYAAAGDRRYAVGNAPAREAHIVGRGVDIGGAASKISFTVLYHIAYKLQRKK
jgi:hypothetical protein